MGCDVKNTGSRLVSELQTTSPRSFLLKPMTARFSVLKNVLSGWFNARDDFLGRPSAKNAVTARICVLYGDFSGRSDSGFPAFSYGAVATYLVSLSLLRNPPPSLLPLLSRFRRRSLPSTGLASIYRLHRLNKAESTILYGFVEAMRRLASIRQCLVEGARPVEGVRRNPDCSGGAAA